jgi:hypothetical protein
MSQANPSLASPSSRTQAQPWSGFLHFLLAIGCVVALALVCFWLLKTESAKLSDHKALTLRHEAQVSANLRALKETRPGKNFAEQLPSAAKTEEVMRYLSQLSAKAQVNVGSVSLSNPALQSQGLYRTELMMNLTGEYSATKELLSQLMARFDNLALQTLSIKPRGAEGNRLDWTAAFSLYIKS